MIQMVDVWLPTTDGRWLAMPRHTQPQPEHKMLLSCLGCGFHAFSVLGTDAKGNVRPSDPVLVVVRK